MRMVDTLSFAAAVGTVMLGSACSDPVPPEPQGVASINLRVLPDNSAGQTCAAQHRSDIPYSPGTSQVLTGSEWGAMLTDGKGGKVSCSVVQKGSGFAATGSIEVPSPAQNWGKVSFSVQIADGQSDAVGDLVLNDWKTGDAYEASDCVFSTSGQGLKVDKGRIWASVKCLKFTSRNLINSVCLVEDSYLLVQNCAQ